MSAPCSRLCTILFGDVAAGERARRGGPQGHGEVEDPADGISCPGAEGAADVAGDTAAVGKACAQFRERPGQRSRKQHQSEPRDQGGRTDVWVQPVEGGPATQLTHVTGFIQSLAFSPTEDRLIYGSDTGGDELPHLYLTDSKGTAPRDLNASSPPGRRHQFVDWAGDGRSFLYLSSDRDEKALDLVEYELGSGRSRIVPENVISEMARRLTPPSVEEGFSKITVVRAD